MRTPCCMLCLCRAPSVGVDRWWTAGSRVMSVRAVAAGNNNWRASGTGRARGWTRQAPAWSLTCSHSRGSSAAAACRRAAHRRPVIRRANQSRGSPGPDGRGAGAAPGFASSHPGPDFVASPFSQRTTDQRASTLTAPLALAVAVAGWLVSPARPSSGSGVRVRDLSRTCAGRAGVARSRGEHTPTSIAFFLFNFPALPLCQSQLLGFTEY